MSRVPGVTSAIFLHLTPDYTSPDFIIHREPLVDNGSTPEQAAQLLTTIWNSSHIIDCQNWQTQVNSNKADADSQKAEKEVENKELEEDTNKEKLEIEKEERKKNKSKYTPISKWPIPSQQPVITSPIMLRKLEKGDYIAPWYWTKPGINAATTLFINSDSQIYNFTSDKNGNTTLIPAISEKEANSVIPDSKLPFDDFLVAIPCMIEAMGQAQWPANCILMMGRYWDNL